MTEVDAWQVAIRLAGLDRSLAQAVFTEAEVNVMRRLLCANLKGGEAAYWDLVTKEIES